MVMLQGEDEIPTGIQSLRCFRFTSGVGPHRTRQQGVAVHQLADIILAAIGQSGRRQLSRYVCRPGNGGVGCHCALYKD
ncbi:hypothetical protein VYU27_005744 [Nannochloropsis oceanica]